MANAPNKSGQMPHQKRRCHRCHGSGQAPCQICGGSAKVPKGRDARGHPVLGRCDGCLGRGRIRCGVCGGDGMV